MAYSEVVDLLVGDIVLGSVDPEKYVNAAADEMDSRIGFVYQLPLPTVDTTPEPLSLQAAAILKNINNKLASGRLIMAQSIGAERHEVHAYGKSLVDEAYAELALVLNGALPLVGAPPVEGVDTTGGPAIYNRDEVSSVEAYEDEFFGQYGVWRPGAAVKTVL